MTTLNLSKLSSVSAGGNVFDILTADRINAIQDAIKYLVADSNVFKDRSGRGLRALQDTKYRQLQEWNYTDGEISLQPRYNGVDQQPYTNVAGVSIPYPRPNNEWDDCDDPLPPLNVWSSMTNTYTAGQNYLEDKGSYFIFNEPGIYEITFDLTAMHKTTPCEPHMNTHSFDIMGFPAIANKGKPPVWTGSVWDWEDGRLDYNSEDLVVIHPHNGFAMFSIHGKQRMPNDTNVHFEFFDEEKKLGLVGRAGIKYPAGECSYVRASSDTCGIVRGPGQSASHGCSISTTNVPYYSLSSSTSSHVCPAISFTHLTACGTPSTTPLVYINDVGSTTSTIDYLTDITAQSSDITFVNETYCDTTTINYIATIDSSTTSLYQASMLTYSMSSHDYVDDTTCVKTNLQFVSDVQSTTSSVTYVTDTYCDTTEVTYVKDVSGQSSGLTYINDTGCTTSTLSYIATIDSSTTSLYEVNQLAYTTDTISFVSETGCVTDTLVYIDDVGSTEISLDYVSDVNFTNTTISIPQLTASTHSVTNCCYFDCCEEEGE